MDGVRMQLITDFLGRKFSPIIDGKIVSLVPSITETLFEIGIGHRVVGVTRYCIYPQEAQNRAIVGGTKSPNVEKIKKLDPDIVIANVEENPKDRIEQISKFTDVFVTYPRTVEESLKMVEDLSLLFNGEIKDRVKHLVSAGNALVSNSNTKRLKVFCPIWKDPWMTINSDTFINDMLLKTGFENIFSEKEERYPVISNRELKEIQPDVIILPTEPYSFSQADVDSLKKDFRNFGGIPIVVVDGSLLSWYGVRTVKGLKYLGQLYSELTINSDPE